MARNPCVNPTDGGDWRTASIRRDAPAQQPAILPCPTPAPTLYYLLFLHFIHPFVSMNFNLKTVFYYNIVCPINVLLVKVQRYEGPSLAPGSFYGFKVYSG